MKKIILLNVLFFTFSIQAQISVESSIGFGKTHGILKETQKYNALNTHYGAGLSYRWAKGGFGIKTGALLYKTSLDWDSAEYIKANILEIPAEFHFIAAPKKKETLYGIMGMNLKIPTKGIDKNKFQNLSVAGVLGAGAQIKIKKIKIYSEIGFHFGLTKFTKNSFNTQQNTLITTEDSVLNTFILKTGIGF